MCAPKGTGRTVNNKTTKGLTTMRRQPTDGKKTIYVVHYLNGLCEKPLRMKWDPTHNVYKATEEVPGIGFPVLRNNDDRMLPFTLRQKAQNFLDFVKKYQANGVIKRRASQTQSEIRRGPGRPKKAETENTETAERRGPGRPKGSKNKPKMEANERRRGPGRPRKDGTIKRSPGRPKGSKNKPKQLEASHERRGPGRPRNTEVAIKRGPGRPKGSKNRVEARRGPGRPAGSKNRVVQFQAGMKRGPGRPKGSKNKPKHVETSVQQSYPAQPQESAPNQNQQLQEFHDQQTHQEPQVQQTEQHSIMPNHQTPQGQHNSPHPQA